MVTHSLLVTLALWLTVGSIALSGSSVLPSSNQGSLQVQAQPDWSYQPPSRGIPNRREGAGTR